MTTFNKGEIPLTLLLLPFMAGLGFAVVFPLSSTAIDLTKLCFAILLALFIILNMAYSKWNIYKVKWVGGILINLLILLAGMIAIETHREINKTDHFSKSKSNYLIVRINSEPKLSTNTIRFTAVVEQAVYQNNIKPVTGNLIISVKPDSTTKNAFAYGDELLIPTNFTPVEPPLNPAEFNYKAYLAHQNIYQQCYLIQKQIGILQRDRGNALIANALKLRKHLVEKLAVNIRDTDALAVASTMLLGYRADLSKQVQEAYAKTGTMHLLAVSGMHVGYIYLLISFILAWLPVHRYSKLIRIILTILLLWSYALITGFSPAVCRATLMLSMVIIGFGFNRHINRLNLLATSAFLLQFLNPFLIADAGFQLSYLVIFGIIILQPIIYQWANFKTGLAKRLWMVCSVSIAAQIILFPVSAFYFHDFPTYFLVSNVFVIVPSVIVMFVGIFYLALPQIPIISSSLGWLIEKTAIIMTNTLSTIEHVPLGSIGKIWLNPLELVLLFCLIGSLFFSIAKHNKTVLKLSSILLVLLAISISVKRYNAMRTDSITFFSLRKHYGILLKNGERALLITDVKPTDKVYQYSVQPYLDSCKVANLQIVDENSNLQTDFAIKKQNMVQFEKQQLLIMNKATQGKIFAGKPDLDYIYITSNPAVDLDFIQQHYNFKLLLCDDHNTTRLIDSLEKDAIKSNVDFRNLKRNNSVILVSNN